MEWITLMVYGKPIAKKRPRFARVGKGVRTYSEQQTEEAQLLISLRQQYKNPPLDCPVELKLLFGMPVPKSTSKKNRQKMLEGRIYHTKKPDLDNLIKFVKDVGNNFLWVDDSRVVGESADKIYVETPFTRIIFRGLG